MAEKKTARRWLPGKRNNWMGSPGSLNDLTNYPIQFEFYDYSTVSTAYPYGNYGEVGNDAFVLGTGGVMTWTPGANSYLCSFNRYAPGELFDNSFGGNAVLQGAYQAAYKAWVSYLGQTLTPAACPSCPTPGSYNVTVPAPLAIIYTCPTGCP